MHGDPVGRLKAEPYVRGAVSAGATGEATLPGLNDAYQAAGQPENHEVSRLVIVMGREGFRPGGTAYLFFQYVHLGLGEFGFTADGQFFRFVFADIQPKLVTVHGRNLLRICDAISLRRMPWIRVADRDFRAADGGESREPIIVRIEVADWVRPEG
jgi:hypothetical protein